MINLPQIITNIKTKIRVCVALLCALANNFSFLRSKINKYTFAIAIDLIIIVTILSFGAMHDTFHAAFISPIQRVLQPLFVQTATKNMFTFVPGSSLSHISETVVTPNTTLAYYDVPLSEDGSLYTDADGYQTLSSQEAIDLFNEAHQVNDKVLLTLSQTDPATIQAILGSDQAEQTAIDQSIQEIQNDGLDGVAIYFAMSPSFDMYYQNRYSNFIAHMTDAFHKAVPHSEVAVAVPDSATTASYPLSDLAKKSDTLFMMAQSFAVPETKNGKIVAPLYDNSKDFWNKLYHAEATFMKSVPSEKIAIETAWYGNGSNFPLHTSDAVARANRNAPSDNTLTTPLSQSMINSLVAGVPQDAQNAARENIPYIAKALQEEGILNQNVLAYALATIEHETAGTFEPIAEYSGRKDAQRLGYEGGSDYYGRGFIQLTHLRNYLTFGERIGMGDALAKDPDLALRPDISAKILAAFFKDNGIARLATEGDFVDARFAINPDQNGWYVADLALKYL